MTAPARARLALTAAAAALLTGLAAPSLATAPAPALPGGGVVHHDDDPTCPLPGASDVSGPEVAGRCLLPLKGQLR